MDFLSKSIANASNSQTRTEKRSAVIKATADSVKEQSKNSVLQMVNNLNQGFQMIWQNPNALSAQEVLDGLGTDASAVFQRHASVAGFLIDQVPALATMIMMPPEDVTITHNEDGTITLTWD